MARAPSKSADAFRTISEVAEEVDVPQHVLRFWETKFPQIKPLKRGGGRRYYRPEDIELIRTIRGWLYDDGYTIKGVQKLLREGAAQQATQSATQQPATEQTATRKPAEAGEAEAPPAGSDTFRAEGVLDFDSGEVDLVEKADEGTGPRPESPAPPAASETAEPAGPDALRAAIRELEAIRDRLRAPGD